MTRNRVVDPYFNISVTLDQYVNHESLVNYFHSVTRNQDWKVPEFSKIKRGIDYEKMVMENTRLGFRSEDCFYEMIDIRSEQYLSLLTEMIQMRAMFIKGLNEDAFAIDLKNRITKYMTLNNFNELKKEFDALTCLRF